MVELVLPKPTRKASSYGELGQFGVVIGSSERAYSFLAAGGSRRLNRHSPQAAACGYNRN